MNLAERVRRRLVPHDFRLAFAAALVGGMDAAMRLYQAGRLTFEQVEELAAERLGAVEAMRFLAGVEKRPDEGSHGERTVRMKDVGRASDKDDQRARWRLP